MTRAILLPTNIVAIKLDSSLVNIEIVLETNDDEDLSNSNFNLFEDTNAISMPEKKAERSKVIITIVSVIYLS